MSGYHLLQMRIKCGLSQQQLGDKLHCSRSQISRIENDLRPVDDDAKALLAEAFDIDTEDVQRLIDKPDPRGNHLNKNEINAVCYQLKFEERMDDLRLSLQGLLDESNQIAMKQLDRYQTNIDRHNEIIENQHKQLGALKDQLANERRKASKGIILFVAGVILFVLILPLIIVQMMWYENAAPLETVGVVYPSVIEITEEEFFNDEF